MALTSSSLPSASLSLLLEGGLRGRPIHSAMSLSGFLPSEVSSSSITSLPLAKLLWLDRRNALDEAAAAALVTFRVIVVLNT